MWTSRGTPTGLTVGISRGISMGPKSPMGISISMRGPRVLHGTSVGLFWDHGTTMGLPWESCGARGTSMQSSWGLHVPSMDRPWNSHRSLAKLPKMREAQSVCRQKTTPPGVVTTTGIFDCEMLRTLLAVSQDVLRLQRRL